MATMKYVASDNTPFDTEAEADAHDAALAQSKQVDTYINAAGLQKAQAGLLRKHLPAFLALVNDGTLPEKEPVKVRKPRTPKPAAASGAAA